MAEKNNWDLPEVEGEFSLIDDLDILDTAEFEIVDLDDKPELKDEPQEPEFESILENDPEIDGGQVIEPSTIIEEKIEMEEAESKDVEVGPEERSPLAEDKTLEEAEARVDEKQPLEEAAEEEGYKASKEDEAQNEYVISSDEAGSSAGLQEEKIEKEDKEMVTKFKQQDLEKMLKSFLEISPDFEAAAIVSADGFVIASVLPDSIDENKLGAMSAAILSLGERAALELEKGKMETVFVEGEKGYVLLSSLTDEALLVVSTSKYAKLGLVFYELSALKKSLSAMFE